MIRLIKIFQTLWLENIPNFVFALNSIWQFHSEVKTRCFKCTQLYCKAKRNSIIITQKHHACVDHRHTESAWQNIKKPNQYFKSWKWPSGSLSSTYHWIISAIWASQWATDSFFAARSWSSSSSCLFCAVNLSTKEQSWNKTLISPVAYVSFTFFSICVCLHTYKIWTNNTVRGYVEVWKF